MFSALKDELVIGEVYVRVYNEQPTFVLEDAKGFATALLDFIGSNAQVSLLMLCPLACSQPPLVYSTCTP